METGGFFWTVLAVDLCYKESSLMLLYYESCDYFHYNEIFPSFIYFYVAFNWKIKVNYEINGKINDLNLFSNNNNLS